MKSFVVVKETPNCCSLITEKHGIKPNKLCIYIPLNQSDLGMQLNKVPQKPQPIESQVPQE